jgi:GTP-binding protein
MQFVDEVSITVSSGKGGPGKVSYRREAMTPRGGPDGGDGGKGGSIVFRADDHLNTLVDLRFNKKYAAPDGEPGGFAKMTGADGQDLIIKVPPGTLIKDEQGTVIKDLDRNEVFVFLKGGRGGKGNTFFKSSVNQAPDHAQPGETGEARRVTLELKLLADVGIIGFPNAGKSTLISRISAARPKIADYPFTTLVPNLGVVRIDIDRSFVVADIPGLVRGAHEGVGLGTQFLRHIERTRFFLHVIDASGSSGRDPLQDLHDINAELAAHDKLNQDREEFQPLAQRPQLVVLNKIDVIPPDDVEDLLRKVRHLGFEAMAISGVTGAGVKDLIFAAGRKLFEEQ